MNGVIETFRNIPGYEGLYKISDYGTVVTLNYNKTGKIKVMKNRRTERGYEQAKLFLNGKYKILYVHRLVWEAFNGPIPDGMQIDHINTVRDDNRLENLRVATPKENVNNPVTRKVWIEAHREAMRKAHNKPVLQLDKKTEKVIIRWESIADAERALGIDGGTISKCCNGKPHSKTAGGFKWRYDT